MTLSQWNEAKIQWYRKGFLQYKWPCCIWQVYYWAISEDCDFYTPILLDLWFLLLWNRAFINSLLNIPRPCLTQLRYRLFFPGIFEEMSCRIWSRSSMKSCYLYFQQFNQKVELMYWNIWDLIHRTSMYFLQVAFHHHLSKYSTILQNLQMFNLVLPALVSIDQEYILYEHILTKTFVKRFDNRHSTWY